MIRVRDATASDIGTIIALGSRAHEESIIPYPPIDPDHSREYMEVAIGLPDIFLNILAEKDGISIGIMMAVAGPYSFSPRLRVANDLLFVLPKYRGTLAAKLLVQRFIEWSDDIGADSTTFGIATGISSERTGRFLEVMGFQPMDMLYWKGCN